MLLLWPRWRDDTDTATTQVTIIAGKCEFTAPPLLLYIIVTVPLLTSLQIFRH